MLNHSKQRELYIFFSYIFIKFDLTIMEVDYLAGYT